VADEHASITLTLTDEMSDRIERINTALDGLQRRFGEAGQSAERAFERTRRPAEELPQKFQGIEEAASKAFGAPIRQAIVELSANLGKLADASMGTGTAMTGAARAAATFALGLGGVASAITAVVGAAALAAVGTYKLAGAINQAYQESKNLQAQLGATETQIKAWTIAFQGLGGTTEDAIGHLTNLTRQVEDLRRGGYAPLARELQRFGEQGVAIWMELSQAQRQGADNLELISTLLERVGDMSEARQKRIAQYLGMNIRQMQLWVQYQREAAQYTEQNAESNERVAAQQEAIAKTWYAMRLQLERMTPLWNLLKSVFLAAADVASNVLLVVMRTIADVVQVIARAWQLIEGSIRNIVRWIPIIAALRISGIANIAPTPEEQEEERRRRGQDHPRGRPTGPAPLPRDRPRVPGRQYGGPLGVGETALVGETGPEYFTPTQPGNIVTGRGSGEITRELLMADREQSSYQREMRDVLVWMRTQMERPGGGTGAWGAGGGRLGGGGAAAGGGMGALPGMGGSQGGAGSRDGTGSNPQGTTDTHSSPQSPAARAEQQWNIGRPGGEFDKPTITGGGAPAISSQMFSPQSATQWRDTIGQTQPGAGAAPTPGVAPGGTPSSAAPTVGGGKMDVAGGQTWFLGKPWTWTDPQGHVWHDVSAERRREGPYASGLPPGTPGFASATRRGLGGWYELTLPDGRKYVTRKVDVGPKGVIDFSAPAAHELFGTQAEAERSRRQITGRYLGDKLPSGVQPGVQGASAQTPQAGTPTVATPQAPPTPPSTGAAGAIRESEVIGPTAPHDVMRGRPLQGHELTPVDTPFGRYRVHPQAAQDFRAFTEDLKAAGAPIHKFGTHNIRPKRYGSGWSAHSYGTAFDIDDEAHLSPAMKRWIAENPEAWRRMLAKNNMVQYMPKKDAPHIEWAGKRPELQARAGKTGTGETITAATDFAAKRISTVRVGPSGEQLAGPPPTSSGGFTLGAAPLPSNVFTPMPTNIRPEPHDDKRGEPHDFPREEQGPWLPPAARASRRRPPPMTVTRTSRMSEEAEAARHTEEEQKENKHLIGDRAWAMHRGQHQPTPDRSNLDRSIAAQTNAGRQASGRMDVHFHNVPRRMRIRAQGEGAFKDMRVSKTPEMAHTGSGTRDAEQYAEE
jgi:hypothetical protein